MSGGDESGGDESGGDESQTLSCAWKAFNRSDTETLFTSLTGRLLVDPAVLEAAADDFGHIVHHHPLAVLHPAATDDIAAIIRYANRCGIKVVMRGQGHCICGQAQARAGIVIDSAGLHRIHQISATEVTVDAGITLYDLLRFTLARGLTPRVLTDYLGLSVGGLLSVGGIGGHTGHFGLVADNVLALQAVLGNGDVVTCSPTQMPQLFNALLGSYGQFGIITGATLPLIPAPASARVYRMNYTRLAPYLADQNRAVSDGRFSYLEGQIIPDPHAKGWIYQLEAASYYRPPGFPDDSLPDDLSPDQTECLECSYFDWQNRLEPVVRSLQEDGSWAFPHPWLTLFLPAQQVESYIHRVLSSLTPSGVNGPVLLYPFLNDKLTRPFINTPQSRIVYLFSLLRTTAPDLAGVNAMMAANRSLFEQARDLGGKLYQGACSFSTQDRSEHFGETRDQVLRCKRCLDPNHILTPEQSVFPF